MQPSIKTMSLVLRSGRFMNRPYILHFALKNLPPVGREVFNFS